MGGGRLRMDLPGIGIVTADDDGEQEDDELVIVSRLWRGGLDYYQSSRVYFD